MGRKATPSWKSLRFLEGGRNGCGRVQKAPAAGVSDGSCRHPVLQSQGDKPIKGVTAGWKEAPTLSGLKKPGRFSPGEPLAAARGRCPARAAGRCGLGGALPPPGGERGDSPGCQAASRVPARPAGFFTPAGPRIAPSAPTGHARGPAGGGGARRWGSASRAAVPRAAAGVRVAVVLPS